MEVDQSEHQITIKSGGDRIYLCKVCYSHLRKGTLPPKSASNSLQVVPVPEHIRLNSYLEEALIAKLLLFIKIFSLKRSRMPAIKDKTVIIPLEDKDILKTVKSLPRLPSESGIIDIQWKRRVGQKNCHLQAKVDPNKIFQALEFLKNCGNQHYQTLERRENYEARCLSEDPDGYELLFGQAETVIGSTQTVFISDDSVEPIVELPYYLYLQEEYQTQNEYESKDVVRKYQIEYDETGCMVEKFPEAMHKDKTTGDTSEAGREESLQAILPNQNNNQVHIAAPGEDKVPIAFCKDWDAKAFPMLHPDGQNHLFEKRKKKLSDQEYIKLKTIQ